jgi:hypothetical protein
VSSKKKILVICYNTLHNDPRVLRQISALKNDFEVTAAGFSDPDQGVKYINLKEYVYKEINFYYNYPFLLRKIFAFLTILYKRFGFISAAVKRQISNLPVLKNTGYFYEKEYWTDVIKEHYNQLKDVDTDIVLANDIHTLPLAAKLKSKNRKLVFDAHEYSPGENDSNPEWVRVHKPRVNYFCKHYFPMVDLMFCVGYAIADEYKKNFGISSVVITNATDYVDLKPQECKGYPIRLIHHGASIPERHLELMIEAMDLTGPDYTLDLMLVPTDINYLNKLKELSSSRPRVKFIEPVPTHEIPFVLNKYDAGIVFIPPVNFNYAFCLPNKFYESVQGRVALILGPTKDMVTISARYDNAVVTKDFNVESLSATIKQLTPEKVSLFKQNSDKCARELNAGKNKELMLQKLNDLL